MATSSLDDVFSAPVPPAEAPPALSAERTAPSEGLDDVFGAVSAAPAPTVAEKPSSGLGDVFGSLPGTSSAPAAKPAAGLDDVFSTAPNPSDDRTISHVDDVDEPWYSKTWDYLNKPLFDLHRNNAGPIEAGVEDVATSLTSPLSVGLALGTFGAGSALEATGVAALRAMGVAEKTAPAVLQGIKVLTDTGFTVEQVKGLASQVPAILDALKDGDYDTAKRLGASSLITGTLAGLGAKGLLKDWGHLADDAATAGIIKPNQTLKVIRQHLGNLMEDQEVNNKNTADLLKTYRAKFDEVAADMQPEEKQDLLGAMNRWIGAGGDAAVLSYRRDAHLGTLQTEPTVKLYRAQPKAGTGSGLPDWVKNDPDAMKSLGATGKWYTADPKIAQEYADRFVGKPEDSEIKTIEVPKSVAEKSRVSNLDKNHPARAFSADPENEFFIDEPKATPRVMFSAVDPKRADDAVKFGLKSQTFYTNPSEAVAAFKAENPDTQPRVFGVDGAEVRASDIDRGKGAEPGIRSGGVHEAKYETTFDEKGKVNGVAPVEQRAEGALDLRQLNPDTASPKPTTELGKLNNSGFLEKYTPEEKAQLEREYNLALNLTEEQKKLATEISQHLEDDFEDAYHRGMINQAVDNYLTNTWKPEDQDNSAFNQLRYQSSNGAFDTNIPFARHRVYQTDFEAEMLGRKKLVSDPIALMANYRHTLKDAMANRTFLEALIDGGLRMPDGRPIAAIAGSGTRLGEESENPAVVINPRGMRTIMIKQEYIRMLDEAGYLRKLIDEGKITRLKDRELIDPESGEKTIQATYGWERGDFRSINHPSLQGWNYITDDHAGAPVYMKGEVRIHPEAEQMIRQIIGADESGLRKLPGYKVLSKVSQEGKHLLLSVSPFHIAQEGLRAIMTGINPFGRLDYDLANDPVLREGVQNGLTLSKDFRGLESFTDGYKGNSAILAKIPGLRQAQSGIQQFLFDRYIPSLKARAYKSLVERYRNLGDIDPMRSAARHTNELFGGLNYRDLGRSATTQDFLRLTTLAPDWLESELRLVKRSLGGEGKAAAVIANQDNFRLAAYLFLATRVMNLMVSGKVHPEAPFGVVQENGPGKDNTVWSVRTLPTDMLHALTEPREFLANRLNPLTVRTAMDLVSGRDEYGRKLPPQNAVFTAAKNVAPIWSQTVFSKMAGFPTDMKFWEQFSRGMGLAPYKYRTEAEKLAQTYASNKMPSGPEDPQAYAKYIRDIHLEDALRAGQVNKASVHQLLGKRAADEIIKRSSMTPIQARFERTTMTEALQIYRIATANEKEQLTTMLWKKRASWLKQHPPAERASDPTWALMKQVYPDL